MGILYCIFSSPYQVNGYHFGDFSHLQLNRISLHAPRRPTSVRFDLQAEVELSLSAARLEDADVWVLF